MFSCFHGSVCRWKTCQFTFSHDSFVSCRPDLYLQLYVWIGKGANEIEKKQSLIAAKEFIKNDPSGRTESDVEMFVVKMGFEPPKFTGHFQAWDPRKWAVC